MGNASSHIVKPTKAVPHSSGPANNILTIPCKYTTVAAAVLAQAVECKVQKRLFEVLLAVELLKARIGLLSIEASRHSHDRPTARNCHH